MAAPQKKFFVRKNTTPASQVEKKSPSSSLIEEKDAASKESVADLKEQLRGLQSKISNLEDSQDGNRQMEVTTLQEWSSPSHVFIPRGKKWITYIVLVAILIILVLLLVGEYFIIAPVVAVSFLAFILSSAPANEIEHRITTEGVISGKRDFLWEEIYDFWFSEKHGHTLLNMDILVGFPGRLIIIVDKEDKEKIKNILLRHLPFREVPKTTWIDSFGDSLSNIFHKIAS
ncbi:MAG: hypothetical protein WD231_05445 [Candidatus Woykebacteria bacterium]